VNGNSPFDPYYYDPTEVRRRLAELAGTPLLPELPSPRQYDVGIGPGQMTPTEIGVRSFMDQLTGRSYNLARPLTSPTNLAILGGTAVAPELAPFASRAFGLGMGTVGLHEAESGKYPEAATSLGLGLMGLAGPSLRSGQRVDLRTTQMLPYGSEVPYAERPAGIVREPEPTGAPGGGPVPARGVPYLARPRSGVSLLGLSIRRDLANRDWVDLRGKQVNTSEDIAAAAQTFRSPQFETFHVLYVNKNGQIAGHEALTSRLPAGVAPFAEGQSARFAYGINSRAKRLEASDVWLLHNHPSGRTIPSREDVSITRSLAGRVPRLRGQLIINDVSYGEISPTGSVYQRSLPEAARVTTGLGEAEVPHPELGRTIMSSLDVASVGRILKTPENMVSLVYRSSDGAVRAIESVPVNLYLKSDDMADWIRGRQREYGASMALSYYDSTGRFAPEVTEAGLKLIRTRAIRDGILGSEGGQTRSLEDFAGVTREPEQWPKSIRIREPEEPLQSRLVSPFYSQLERVIEAKMPNVTTVDQLQGILKDPRIKGTELEATGLQRWLDTFKGSTKKITKDEVRRQLALGKVELKDVTYAEEDPAVMAKRSTLDAQIKSTQSELNDVYYYDRDAKDWLQRVEKLNKQLEDLSYARAEIPEPPEEPKFGRQKLQLEGGTNYREKLLVMPGGEKVIDWRVTGPGGRVRTFPTEAEARIYTNQWYGRPDPPLVTIERVTRREPYVEPHFNVEGVVAHGRFTDRTTTAGEPMLFGEELQSQAALDVRKAREAGELSPWKGFPFEKNWHELMLWRALRMAAEEGKTRFGWTTGEQQIERYNLGRHIDSLSVAQSPQGHFILDMRGGRLPGGYQVTTVSPEQLPDYVGTELAQKIKAEVEPGGKFKDYSGLDLRVGGEGKRQLYDQMLTQAANRIGKRYGAKVEDVTMPTNVPQIVQTGNTWIVKSTITGQPLYEGATRQAAMDFINEMQELGSVAKGEGLTTVHSIPITPDLYQALMGEGRPLFQSPLPFLAGGAGAALAGAAAAQKGKAQDADYEYDRATGKVRRVK